MGRMLRPIVCAFISVYAPPSVHHRRQQLGLLLVSAGQILSREIVARIVLDALLAIRDKLVNDVEILVEGYVDRCRGEIPSVVQARLIGVQTP